MEVKILGVSGSPRYGNTAILLEEALSGAEDEGAETKSLSLVNKNLKPCIHCDKCPIDEETFCVEKDDMQEIYGKLLDADGLILGTPVYYGGVSAQLKAMMDRCYAFSRAAIKRNTANLMRLKVGGAIAVAAARHGGQENAIHGILHYFMINDMIPVSITTPHSQIGATGIGYNPGDVKKNEWYHWAIGRKTSSLEMARQLGRKVAILAKIVKAGRKASGLDIQKPYGLDLK